MFTKSSIYLKKIFAENTTAFYLIICIILLSPILFLAVSNDIAIFMIAGKIIAGGGRIYHDYIDIKPPFFFQIYSWIYLLFGFSEMSPRIADLIIQLITAFVLYKIATKIFAENYQRILPGIIYIIIYVSLGNSLIGYPESFLGLFISLIIYLIIYKATELKSLILLGILCGLASGMKYTFAIGLIPVIILLLLKEFPQKSKILSIIYFFITFFIVILLSHNLIFNSNSLNDYTEIIKMLKHYAAINSFNIELLKDFLNDNSIFWGYFISFIICFYISVTIYTNIISKNNKFSSIIHISILLILFLFLSIITEKKFSNYIFSRVLIPVSLLSSIGIVIFIDKCKENYKSLNKSYLILIIFTGFIFSPLIKYSKSLIITYSYFTNTNNYNNYYKLEYNSNGRILSLKIAEYIKQNTPKSSKILIISNGANVLSYFLNDYKQSAFAHSLFYLNNYDLSNYKNKFLGELIQSQLLLINTDDASPEITGQDKSSLFLLKNDTTYKHLLDSLYKYEVSFDHFAIYRSRKK